MDDRKTGDRGFDEIAHIADWGVRVWAPDLPALFETAAQSMYALMEVRLADGPRVSSQMELEAGDLEGLLVRFLDELLYFGFQDLAYDQIKVTLVGYQLAAVLEGAPIVDVKKEIKAVTFHNLAIQSTPQGFEVTIIFDV